MRHRFMAAPRHGSPSLLRLLTRLARKVSRNDTAQSARKNSPISLTWDSPHAPFLPIDLDTLARIWNDLYGPNERRQGSEASYAMDNKRVDWAAYRGRSHCAGAESRRTRFLLV